jgi:hypothetical protein
MNSATDADAKFNSLQVTLRKQFSQGFQAQMSYSFSRGYATNFGNNDPNIGRYQPNTAYHPERVVISYLWNLPGNFQGFLGKVANGWGWSGVTTIQNGTPLTITDSKGGTIFGSVNPSTAEYCMGMGAANAASAGSLQQRLGGPNGGQGYFNKAAFIDTVGVGAGCATAGAAFPTYGTNGTGYGDSSYGILLGPGQFNWDMSLTKTTKVGGIHEDATLQFRTEFFNTFNHPQFNNPTSTSVTSGSFGLINSASVNPRLLQFALKYIF